MPAKVKNLGIKSSKADIAARERFEKAVDAAVLAGPLPIKKRHREKRDSQNRPKP